MAVYTPPGELGSLCPDFHLPATDSHIYGRRDFKGSKALLVMFICNHCPYVQAVEQRIVHLSQELLKLGVQIVAISSNDAKKYPADSFENMKRQAQEKKYPFPYLYDESQTVAKLFGAVCTPDFFVYDENLLLAYRGRLDDSWKDPGQVSRQELRHAILELLAGREAPLSQYPSMGCSIKWKEM
jgi:peroxiredoxin